jgi:hypothetical protein
VVPAEVLAGAAARAELVADRLGLAGLAAIDAFMNADTAELIVLEADPVPSLAPASDLLQQVLRASRCGAQLGGPRMPRTPARPAVWCGAGARLSTDHACQVK